MERLSSEFGTIMRWIINQFRKLVDARIDQLPEKCVRKNFPKIYWVECPQHCNFNNNLSRRKMNSVIQSECSLIDGMKIMRMKKIWDPEESQLYLPSHSRFTSDGIFKYWGSIDNAIEFNDNKLEEFLSSGRRNYIHNKQNKDQYKWSKTAQFKYSRRADDLEYNQKYLFKLPKPKSLNY